MPDDTHIPRIETYYYNGLMFRIAVLSDVTLFNVRLSDRMASGYGVTEAAAKTKAKKEIDDGIRSYERERIGSTVW